MTAASTCRTVAISTAAFDGYPIDVVASEIVSLGANYVEPAYIRGYTAFDETSFSKSAGTSLRTTLEAWGLAARTLSAHVDASADGASDLIVRRMRFAGELGAQIVIVNAGPSSRQDGLLRNIDVVLRSSDAAGVTLALENPGHGDKDLLGRPEEALAFFNRFDRSKVALNLDIGNIYTYAKGRPDVLDVVQACAYCCASFHFKTVHEEGPDWEFASLDRGVLDYTTILGLIADVTQSIPCTIELPLRLSRPGQGSPVRAPDPIPLSEIRLALQRSYAFVRTGLARVL